MHVVLLLSGWACCEATFDVAQDSILKLKVSMSGRNLFGEFGEQPDRRLWGLWQTTAL